MCLKPICIIQSLDQVSFITFIAKCVESLEVKFSMLFKKEPVTLIGVSFHDLKGRFLKTFICSVVKHFMWYLYQKWGASKYRVPNSQIDLKAPKQKSKSNEFGNKTLKTCVGSTL